MVKVRRKAHYRKGKGGRRILVKSHLVSVKKGRKKTKRKSSRRRRKRR